MAWRKPPVPLEHKLSPQRLNVPGAFLTFRDGQWMLFRNRWKSQWPSAAAVCAPTIPQLIEKLRRQYDASSFGGKYRGKAKR